MCSSIDANIHSFSHSFTGKRKVNVILFLPSGSPFLLPHSVKWGKQTSKQTLSAMCLRLYEKYTESSDLAYLFKLARWSSHFKIKWWILILKGALTPCISQGSVRFLKILYQRHRKPHEFKLFFRQYLCNTNYMAITAPGSVGSSCPPVLRCWGRNQMTNNHITYCNIRIHVIHLRFSLSAKEKKSKARIQLVLNPKYYFYMKSTSGI